MDTKTKRHWKYIAQLERLLEDNPSVHNARVGAMIVIKNEIYSVGFNQEKTHPLAKRFSRHPDAQDLHAEHDAIVKVMSRLSVDDFSKATLYVCRIKRPSADSDNWVLGMSKPCAGCQKAIDFFKFKNVIYTTDEGKIAEI